MNSFYNLPTELQTYIYEFDSTYHRKFEGVLDKISLLNAHRYFYHDKEGNILFEYITPESIDNIFEKRLFDVNQNYKDSLKNMLNESYNFERFNIMNEKCDNLYLEIIHNQKYDNDYNLQIPSFWISNPINNVIS